MDLVNGSILWIPPRLAWLPAYLVCVRCGHRDLQLVEHVRLLSDRGVEPQVLFGLLPSTLEVVLLFLRELEPIELGRRHGKGRCQMVQVGGREPLFGGERMRG